MDPELNITYLTALHLTPLSSGQLYPSDILVFGLSVTNSCAVNTDQLTSKKQSILGVIQCRMLQFNVNRIKIMNHIFFFCELQ